MIVASYIRDLFLPPDPQLEAALQRAAAAGLRSIQVPPELGRLLGILVQATGARRVLEIGTLGGYSAIHLARALPTDGRLISLEIDDRHAQVARENLSYAGLADRAEVRVGAALDLLPALTADAPFDLVFTQDATGARGRLHHLAYRLDNREDVLRAADLYIEHGIPIENGPGKHPIGQTFFVYVYEPGGNRVELCAGGYLIVARDWQPVRWTEAERARGQAWGASTVASFHTYGTPVLDELPSVQEGR